MGQHLEKGRRRSLRRAVTVPCTLRSVHWEGELHVAASDVSVTGMWIEITRGVAPGTELIVCFTPPRGDYGEKVWASARVARVGVHRRPPDGRSSPGIGIVFIYCSDRHLRLLAPSLEGCPPKLPGRRGPPPLPA
jgi:hypothetical protein